MEVLDTSIANMALPHIAGGMSASEDESTWVLTSYLVSNAIILPLSGWLSLLLGRKLLHDLRCGFHAQLVCVRHRSNIGPARFLSPYARHRRRRSAVQRAGYLTDRFLR